MSEISKPTVDQLAQILWDYHLMHHSLSKSDVILLLGSNDIRVAERAAQVFNQGYAPVLVCSGNIGILTEGMWKKTEAEVFAEVVMDHGVPQDKILIENKSTNTGDNIKLSRKILAENKIIPKKIIIVQKPYMERRAYATAKNYWPGIEFIITSPQISFSDYPNETLNKELIINLIVGDLQRIKLYPALGYQIPQEIPNEVWVAYQKLVELGYTHHLIKE
ncbi:MAG: YdcF family protein [bacterium]